MKNLMFIFAVLLASSQSMAATKISLNQLRCHLETDGTSGPNVPMTLETSYGAPVRLSAPTTNGGKAVVSISAIGGDSLDLIVGSFIDSEEKAKVYGTMAIPQGHTSTLLSNGEFKIRCYAQ